MANESLLELATAIDGFFGISAPESALKKRFIAFSNYMQLSSYGYYLPVISLVDLALLYQSHPYHQAAIDFEVRKIMEFYAYSADGFSLIDPFTMTKIVKDERTFGHAYYLKQKNIVGTITAIEHLPALYMRKMQDGRFCLLDTMLNQPVKVYPAEAVGEIYSPSFFNNVYGVPDYIAQVQMVLFGEDSVLTPRRELTGGATRKILAFMGLSKENADRTLELLAASKGKLEKILTLFLPDKDGKKITDVLHSINDDGILGVDFEKYFRLSAETIIECRQIPWFMWGATPDQGSAGLDIDKVERIYMRKVLDLIKPFEKINSDCPNAVVWQWKTMRDFAYSTIKTQQLIEK